ncbi:MAG: rhodanese-like domain-containing protein [Cyanobacteria bacterium P01_F01_bin.86]
MPTLVCPPLKRLFTSMLCLPIMACSGWSTMPPAAQYPDNQSKDKPFSPSSSPSLKTIKANSHPSKTPILAPNALEQRWVVSATEAAQLIEAGATLLDARGQGLIRKRLQGSVAINWKNFSPQDAATRGRLLDDDTVLTQRLQALGVSHHTPVVVFSNPPGGWGEDGRIVWMLRTLGHQQVVLVDGGFQALVKAGVPLQTGTPKSPQPGNFIVRRNSTWDIQRDTLKKQLGSPNFVVIDTREPREFSGKTPYGEQRGGHIPGSINLYFKDLLDADGHLLTPQALNAKLQDIGITAATEVVVYCTGGIRSGWLASVLVSQGFSVKNYAGSMWEWSANSATQYPLETLNIR